MRSRVIVSAAVLAASASMLAAADPQPATGVQTPAIIGTGDVHSAPDATYLPQQQDEYSIAFSITRASDNPAKINPALREVARMVNIYTYAGVPLSHLHFVAVIHEGAIDAALDSAHYRSKYGIDNPNLPLIRTLRAAGVDVMGSAQSLPTAQQGGEPVASDVTLALSGMTALVDLERKGYSLIQL